MKAIQVLIVLLAIGLMQSCSKECTQTAIKKLPFVVDRPECDTWFVQDFVVTPGNAALAGIQIVGDSIAIVTGNFEISGVLDLNGYDLKIGGELYAEELIVTPGNYIEADWGLNAGKVYNNGTMKCPEDINIELLFGTGRIEWCTSLNVQVNNGQGIEEVINCPEPFDDQATLVEVPCSNTLPYVEVIDGVAWIFVEP